MDNAVGPVTTQINLENGLKFLDTSLDAALEKIKLIFDEFKKETFLHLITEFPTEAQLRNGQSFNIKYPNRPDLICGIGYSKFAVD